MRVKKLLVCLVIILTTVLSIDYSTSIKAVEEKHNDTETIKLIKKHEKEIIASCRFTGIYPSVVMSQLIQEVGYDLSPLASDHNNLFGVKWNPTFANDYPGSKEGPDGFAHFVDYSASITQHSIIWWNGMYPGVLDVIYDLNSTPEQMIDAIEASPYCENAKEHGYGAKMKQHMSENNFKKYDKIAFPNGRKYAGYGDKIVGEYSYPDDGYNLEDIKNKGTSVVGSDGTVSLIVKEEDLVGMYPKNIISEKMDNIYLPDYDSLNTAEKQNVITIRDNILESKSWSIWDTLRVFTVFIGLFVLVYAVLFYVAYIFDKVNNVIDISLVSILSLGSLKYTDEDAVGKGYVNGRRLFRIEAALFLVGFFLVAGGVFSFTLEVMYFLKNIVG